MSNQSCDSTGVTAESVAEIFSYYEKQLQDVDRDIYPMDLLSAAVNAMSFVATKRQLKSSVNTEEFRKLFDVVDSKINDRPRDKELRKRGFTDEDLEVIEVCSRLFHDLKRKIPTRMISVSSVRIRRLRSSNN